MPRRDEEVPRDALACLKEACGVESLGQVFLIPRAIRSMGGEDAAVVSPDSVLALGYRAVGLWTDAPVPGVKVLIPLETLSAVEDVTVLLYGRLSFLSFGERLTVRYNTLGRRALEPALLELRKRLAGSPQSLPEHEETACDLPYKWKRILGSSHIRLNRDASVAFRYADVPCTGQDDVERGQLLVLNPHELVFMCDPPRTPHRYGEDSFIIPRSGGIIVRPREKSLEIVSNGAHFSLSMATSLCEAASRWFSDREAS